MAWYNDFEDFGSGIKSLFMGEPDKIKQSYDDAMGQSRNMGKGVQDFLLGQQGKALAFYNPLQQMFQGAYGSQGLQTPQNPGTPGMNPLEQMYGGGK